MKKIITGSLFRSGEVRMKKLVTISSVLVLTLATPSLTRALTYEVDMESYSCGTVIGFSYDGQTLEGMMWDLYGDPNTQPVQVNKCSSSTPSGANYLELVTPTNTHGGLIQFFPPSIQSLASGGVHYLAGFFKFIKTGDDVWADSGQPDSWDKLFGFCGPNCYSGSTIRWGIGVGWPASVYTATNGKFTFDLWCAQSAFSACTSADHKAQNRNGYSKSTPFLADYGKWYAIVVEVKVSTSSAMGHAREYVNGTLTTQYNGVTTGTSNTQLGYFDFNGTFAQPGYNIQSHTRHTDGLIFTDDLNYLQTHGYFADPEADGVTAAAPSLPRGLTLR